MRGISIARIVAALALPTLAASAQAGRADASEVPWSDLPAGFSCEPGAVRGDADIVLRKAAGTGGELGVATPDDRFFFLVPAQGDAPLGIDAAGFATAPTLRLRTGTLQASPSEGVTRRRVFRAPGVYTFYLSDRLESGDGGFVCRVRYRAGARVLDRMRDHAADHASHIAKARA